jgi:hypothetical protein
MIGILLYLTTSRPDIMQVVGLVAWFQAAPKETHVQAVKIIFRYLKGTLDFILWYSRGEYFTLTTYTMWIGKEMLMIGKVQVEEHSFWATV